MFYDLLFIFLIRDEMMWCEYYFEVVRRMFVGEDEIIYFCFFFFFCCENLEFVSWMVK